MSRRLARAAGLLLPLALVATGTIAASSATPSPQPTPGALAQWQSWQKVSGIFDLAGPRSDGRLVLAAKGQLSLVSPDGTIEPFARGPGGYQVAFDAQPEAYIAVSSGQRDQDDGCAFNRDDVFVLDTGKPPGVIRVDSAGVKSRLADLASENAGGITFDTTGTFGNRLVVTGALKGKGAVYTIGCNGKVRTVTEAAPNVEGGIAVAPKGFGAFGGALVAPDENSGLIFAIDPAGAVRTTATSTLPTGGDIGVESIGFIPDGFHARGGVVYVADRLTPGNPHPGNDALLRINAADLEPFGIADGDMLVATEGGDFVELVHCAETCTIKQVAGGVPTAHGEGHVVAVAKPSQGGPVGNGALAPADTGSASRTPLIIAVVAIVLVAAIVVVILVVRRRRRNYLGPAAEG